MLVGSHFAGIAIEQSMLGAAHACSNPLTARYDLAHGLALSILLPHVVRWNAPAVSATDTRRSLDQPMQATAAEQLARTLEGFAPRPEASAGGFTITAFPPTRSPELAGLAAEQWTGTFNPRPFDAAGALEIYRMAYGQRRISSTVQSLHRGVRTSRRPEHEASAQRMTRRAPCVEGSS